VNYNSIVVLEGNHPTTIPTKPTTILNPPFACKSLQLLHGSSNMHKSKFIPKTLLLHLLAKFSQCHRTCLLQDRGYLLQIVLAWLLQKKLFFVKFIYAFVVNMFTIVFTVAKLHLLHWSFMSFIGLDKTFGRKKNIS
jgi:hypothetical protein